MMSPYGAAEKQALLEAPDLKTRAEILVALTEIELAKKNTDGETQLQYDCHGRVPGDNACTMTDDVDARHKAGHDDRDSMTTTPPTERPPAASIRSCWKSWSAR